MTNIIIGLFLLGLLAYLIGYAVKGEISISPIVGFMAGSLYSKTDYEDATEHTVQVCIFIIAITVIWETPTG